MEQSPVIGRPGALLPPDDVPDMYATRMGGRATYPEHVEPLSEEMTTCPICKSKLALILQTHAPVVDAEERFFFIFGCIKEGCGIDARCWRAFRCQVPLTSLRCPRDSLPSPDAVPAVLEQAKDQSNDWGLDYDTNDVPFVDEDPFDFSALDAALKTASEASSRARDGGTSQSNTETSSSIVEPLGCKKPQFRGERDQKLQKEHSLERLPVQDEHVCCPMLPSFYLWADKEKTSSECDQTNLRKHKNGATIAGSTDKALFQSSSMDEQELSHILELLQRYEKEEEAGRNGCSSSCKTLKKNLPPHDEPSSTSKSTRMASHSKKTPSMGGWSTIQEEAWHGELYEEDAVLASDGRAHADKAFLKMSTRLAKIPDQCARYCFGGKALWPEATVPGEGLTCPLCNARRVFEVQVMSPALVAMEEAAAWWTWGQVAQPPSSWAWITVGVWSCEKSCGEGFIEEYIDIVNDECDAGLPSRTM